MKNTGVSIDFDKCNYCMECIEHCRGEALTEKDGEIIINNDECQLCESCMGYCDEQAITLTFANGSVVCR